MEIKPRESKSFKSLLSSRILILLGGVYCVVMIWNLYSTSYFKKAATAIIAGDYNKAKKELKGAESLSFNEKKLYEFRGIIALLQGDRSLASAYFNLTKQTTTASSLIPPEVLLGRLVLNGDYQSVLFYWNRLRKKDQKKAAVKLMKLCALNGLKNYQTGEHFSYTGSKQKLAEEFKKQLEIAKQCKSTGSSNVIVDRNGIPLAQYNVAQKEIIPVCKSFSSFLKGEDSILKQIPEKDINNTISFSLDRNIQQYASEILETYNGSVVVLNAKNGDIIAAVSKSSEKTTLQNNAFYKQYQPASIVKLLVWDGAMKFKCNMEKLLPYQCKGDITVNGKTYYCWKKHGKIKSADDAIAQSCNSFFQELALELGIDKLNREFSSFAFDSDLSNDFAIINSGKLKKGINNNIDNLFLRAIGHENISVTPVHATLIASAIANKGIMVRPRLVLSIANIQGYDYYKSAISYIGRATTAERADILKKAMLLTVTDSKGSGHKSAINSIDFGIKTGTARNSDGGLDTVIIGFAPYENPQIAFSIFAENAGSASAKGAEMTKELILLLLNQGYLNSSQSVN